MLLGDAISTAQNFVNMLSYVYLALILVYILLSWIPLPYTIWLNRIQRFLYDVVEPYLRIFRRILPSSPSAGSGSTSRRSSRSIVAVVAAEVIVEGIGLLREHARDVAHTRRDPARAAAAPPARLRPRAGREPARRDRPSVRGRLARPRRPARRGRAARRGGRPLQGARRPPPQQPRLGREGRRRAARAGRQGGRRDRRGGPRPGPRDRRRRRGRAGADPGEMRRLRLLEADVRADYRGLPPAPRSTASRADDDERQAPGQAA